MSEQTPSTEEARETWVAFAQASGWHADSPVRPRPHYENDEGRAEAFDAWLDAVKAQARDEGAQHHDSDQATIAATETLLAEYDADELTEGHERAEYLAEQLRELLTVAKRILDADRLRDRIKALIADEHDHQRAARQRHLRPRADQLPTEVLTATIAAIKEGKA